VHEKMRERLARLSAEASDAVTVAASLGRTFTFDELARTLGQPASDLLAPVGELLEASLLVERGEKLAFWHDLTREAVRASVPITAPRALARPAARSLPAAHSTARPPSSCSRPARCRSKSPRSSRTAPRSVTRSRSRRCSMLR